MLGFFSQLSIQKKQWCCSLLPIGVVVGLAWIALAQLAAMEATLHAMTTQVLPKANAIGAVNERYWMRRLRAGAYLHTSSAQERAQLRAAIREADQKLDAALNSYQQAVQAGEDPEEAALFEKLNDFIVRDRTDMKKLLALADGGAPGQALAWEKSHSRPLYLTSGQYFDASREYTTHAAQQAQTVVQQRLNTFRWQFPLACVLALGLMAAMGWWMASYMGGSLRAIIRVARQIADGDLSGTIPRVATGDEIGALSDALSQMLGNMRELIARIKRQVSTVTTSSVEMLQTAQHIDQMAGNLRTASQTASELTERLGGEIQVVGQSVDVSTQNVRHVQASCQQVDDNGKAVGESAAHLAVNMREMSQAADQMSDSVHTIASAMEQMSASINEVAGSASQAAKVTDDAERRAATTRDSVNALGESAQEIGNVLGLIRNIASQTNLLALNASIEAASAGDAGKGFAVVANEVKELAKQSAEATDVIRQRIEEMQNSTDAAIGEIGSITGMISQINGISTSMASAIEQQAATVQEVGRSVIGVAAAAQQVAGNVTGSAQLAGDVAQKAEKTLVAVGSITQSLGTLSHSAEAIERSMTSAATCSQDMHQRVRRVQDASRESEQRSRDIKQGADALATISAELTELINNFNLCPPYIVWSDHYAVGIPSIDTQHQYLFKLINQLNEAVQTNTSGVVMGKLLEGLINYTVSHFNLEETYMGQTDYPDARAHIEQHERFKVQVGEFYQQFQAGNAVVDDAVLTMLTNWLKGHVLGSDAQYKHHFRDRGVR